MNISNFNPTALPEMRPLFQVNAKISFYACALSLVSLIFYPTFLLEPNRNNHSAEHSISFKSTVTKWQVIFIMYCQKGLVVLLFPQSPGVVCLPFSLLTDIIHRITIPITKQQKGIQFVSAELPYFSFFFLPSLLHLRYLCSGNSEIHSIFWCGDSCCGFLSTAFLSNDFPFLFHITRSLLLLFSLGVWKYSLLHYCISFFGKATDRNVTDVC